MKRIIPFIFGVLLVASCDNKPKFSVSGKISGAEDKILYVENLGIGEILTLDSVKLTSKGDYKFSINRPEAIDFYRLRLEDRVINFSVDSLENIVIDSNLSDFDSKYDVSGSEESLKIKELVSRLSMLRLVVDLATKEYKEGKIGYDEYQNRVDAEINQYKSEVKDQFVYSNPASASAYFALFQKLYGSILFNPYGDKEDVRVFAAVATSYDNKYPNALRTQNLKNIALKGMRDIRKINSRTEDNDIEVKATGIIDISLKDEKGSVKKLSDLKGKVVILDFVVYEEANSGSHNLVLRDLYNKYSSRGLEIYQVSFDGNEHLWKSSAVKFPWICVRDDRGIYSPIVRSYNVNVLPTLFIVDRNNELKARGESLSDIEKTIQQLL